MMKNQLDISLPNPNFNLYRFQKIQLFIVKGAATVSAPETIQWRYSGEWLIASIKFVFLNGSLTQEVTLARKEMGKNPDEIKQGTNNGTKETKDQKNENPIVGTASATITNNPNSIYKAGDVLTVQDSEGKRYVLTISKLSENGTDVVASLKYPSVIPNTAVTGPDTIVGVTQSTVLVATASESYSASDLEYSILVENAQSDADKKISGTISFKKTGLRYSTLGTLNGLPNPFNNISTGLPVANNTGSLSYTSQELVLKDSELSILVDQTIYALQEMVADKYGVRIKLVATRK
jgi:hypothetical protein